MWLHTAIIMYALFTEEPNVGMLMQVNLLMWELRLHSFKVNWKLLIGDTFHPWKSGLWPVHSDDGFSGSAALADPAFGVHLVCNHPHVHLQS